VIRILQDSYVLMIRALRDALRQPAVEITNIFIPMFFFAVTVGAIGNVAGVAFGVDNFLAFQMPVAILQAVAGVAGSAGMGTVTDIERGYFDKLLLTPTPRLSLVLGRLLADAVRSMALTLLIIVVGLITGSGMETGVLGIVLIIFMAGLFGLSYAGIGMSIALRTGSPQAAQAGFLLFFPLLFLSPAFAPKEVFAGWLEFLATLNPITYILQGMREMILEGWDLGSLAAAFGSIGGFALVTLSLTLAALRSRTA
jgi:ABC-2 type transport system permease protein